MSRPSGPTIVITSERFCTSARKRSSLRRSASSAATRSVTSRAGDDDAVHRRVVDEVVADRLEVAPRAVGVPHPDQHRAVHAGLGERPGHDLGDHRPGRRGGRARARRARSRSPRGSRAPCSPSALAVPDGAVRRRCSVIASDEFCTMARNSSSLVAQLRLDLELLRRPSRSARCSSAASDSLISSSALARLAPLGDVARVDRRSRRRRRRRCRLVATISSQRYSPLPPRIRTSNGRQRRAAATLAQRPEDLGDQRRRRRGARCPDRAKLAPTSKPGEPRGRRAEVLDVAVLAVHEHVVRRVLGQRAEPLLARAHRLLGAHAGQRRDRARHRRPRAARAPRGSRGGCAGATTSVTEPIASSTPLTQSASVPRSAAPTSGAYQACCRGPPPSISLVRAASTAESAPTKRASRSSTDDDPVVDVVDRRGHQRARGLGHQRFGRDAGLERAARRGCRSLGLVGDVLERADVAGDRPVGVADRGEARARVADLAVRAEHAHLAEPLFARARRGAHRLEDRVAVVGVRDAQVVGAEDVLGADAADLEPTVVDVDDPAGDVGVDDARARDATTSERNGSSPGVGVARRSVDPARSRPPSRRRTPSARPVAPGPGARARGRGGSSRPGARSRNCEHEVVRVAYRRSRRVHRRCGRSSGWTARSQSRPSTCSSVQAEDLEEPPVDPDDAVGRGAAEHAERRREREHVEVGDGVEVIERRIRRTRASDGGSAARCARGRASSPFPSCRSGVPLSCSSRDYRGVRGPP